MDKKRFLILLHESFEGPGYILDWIINNGHQFSLVKLYRDDALPLHASYDILVVMGGSMGANDECRYPWLEYEKRFVREAINKGKKVLGICLGAQIIANALGAKVYENAEPEIGFWEIEFNNAAHSIFEMMPGKSVLFHWHADTFDLPVGATLLASSEACKNQAFVYDNNVLAIQFHPEITNELIQQYLNNNNHLPADKKFVQNLTDITEGEKYITAGNKLLNSILKVFVTNTKLNTVC